MISPTISGMLAASRTEDIHRAAKHAHHRHQISTEPGRIARLLRLVRREFLTI